MKYNLSTQARLQAQKDICEELAKEGKTYIDVSLKALQAFEGFELDCFRLVDYSLRNVVARGKNGKYNTINRHNRWAI